MGKKLISQHWLALSTTATIPIPDFSFTKLSRSIEAMPQPTYYGFNWYNELLKINNEDFPLIFASGNGGQYIIIVNKLNLVVVFTPGNYGTWIVKQAFDMLAKYTVPNWK